MKLEKRDIQYIDRWLQFVGIQYLDVRYELIDHLVTEFEELDEKTSLNEFVKSRIDWCKSTAKNKEKMLHWAVQKGLWKQLLKILINVKYIVCILLFVGLVFSVQDQFSQKNLKWILLTPVFATIVRVLYLVTFKSFSSRKRERVLAINKLMTLFWFPQILIIMFPSVIKIRLDFLWPGVVFMTLLNLAVIFEYIRLHKKVAKEYEFLKKELV